MLLDVLEVKARVEHDIVATSCDPAHEVNQVREDGGFWMSTGTFPQEIVIKLKQPAEVREIRVQGRGMKLLQLYKQKDPRSLT